MICPLVSLSLLHSKLGKTKLQSAVVCLDENQPFTHCQVCTWYSTRTCPWRNCALWGDWWKWKSNPQWFHWQQSDYWFGRGLRLFGRPTVVLDIWSILLSCRIRREYHSLLFSASVYPSPMDCFTRNQSRFWQRVSLSWSLWIGLHWGFWLERRIIFLVIIRVYKMVMNRPLFKHSIRKKNCFAVAGKA